MKLPSNISLNQEQQYCINCFATEVRRVFKDGLTYYRCGSCGQVSERVLEIDNKISSWIDSNTREYWHESVGVFVFNSENKFLLFQRLIYPFALTIPAGHLDTGETPEAAVRRELQEEVGIETTKLTLFSTEDLAGDSCRRGTDHHKWHLFTARVQDPTTIHLNDEGSEPVWVTFDEAATKELTYATRYFIDKYGKKLLS